MIARVLPETEWRDADGLKRVIAALTDEQGGPRIVGGAVRDSLLGLPVTDVDLATMLHPNAVMDRLEAAHIKAVPTGLDHGTVTAVADGKNYEITTLRRDVATDGRRATVAFATDWLDDAARRDFTINALYADPNTGEIFDYFDGLADLEAGTIRFIGNADQRIAEDFLRILRYFRFLARFGRGDIDRVAVAACAAGAHGLTALSRERIAQELVKILSLVDPVEAVQLMVEHAIFTPFLPELQDDAPQQLRRLVEREQQNGSAVSLPARLLSLLPKDTIAVDKVAARLKLSNKLRENLATRLAAPDPSTNNILAIAYRGGVECAYDVTMLYSDNGELPACLSMLDGWAVPEFPIKGGDLIALGLPVGPVVAKTLQELEARWIAENFPAKSRVTELASQFVSAALSASKNA